MAAEPLRLDFGLSSDPGRHGADAGPMHWNCYAEPVTEGKHPAPIYAHDGWDTFAASTATSPIRGMIGLGQAIYALQGTTLSRVSSTGVRSTVGGIAGTARAVMARNAKSGTPQIAIVVDGDRYVCENDVISPIDDADLPPPNSVTFLNQKVVYGLPDGRFFWSAIDNVSSISSLDFAEAEGNPDGGVRVIAHMQDLWIFGNETIEPWRDTGNGFARVQGTVIPKGCIGTHTVAQLDKDIFWVGDDNVVYMASGIGSFQRISHHGVERAIRTTADKTELVGWTYFRDGSAFYVLRGDTWTWQYNRTYQHWAPRFSYDSTVGRWNAEYAVQVANQWIVGSNVNDALYEFNASTHSEAGQPIIWRARCAPIHAFPRQMCHDRLFLDFVTGVGLNSTTAHEMTPQVGLRWSDDGGVRWSNQRLKSLGLIGKRQTRVVFDGLGITGRSGRIYEVEASAPVVRALMYAAVDGDLVGT